MGIYRTISNLNSRGKKGQTGKPGSKGNLNKKTFPPINKELHETIIGLALGDLFIRRRYTNTTLNFKGSQIH